MGEVIGELLPLALGVAISPVPIIAVILMLLTPQAGAASRGFLVGWVAGIVIGLAVFAVLAAVADLGSGGSSAVGMTIQLLLGAALLLLGARQWRSRPRDEEPAQLPGWLKAIDKVTPITALGIGFLLSAINPKNLVLLIGAGVDLGREAGSAGTAAVAGVVFVLLAASTVLIPVIAYAVARERVRSWLGSLREWLTENNAAVMTVLLVVMGAVLVGKGVGGR